MSVPTNVVLAVAVVIFLLAASLSRVYATGGRLIVIVIAMVLYVIGNLLMVRIMREMGLGIAISLATIAQLILINVVAYAFFQERPTALQLSGILLGAVSMALIMFPTGQR
jgi:glucose uptake protein